MTTPELLQKDILTFVYVGYIDNPIEMDLSELRPSTEIISLRLPQYLLARIKQIAHFKDVPYQSLMKLFLAERVEKELRVDRNK